MALLNNESSKELVKKYNLPPGPATNKGIYEKLLLEGKLDAVENPNYVAPEETTYDIPRGWPKYPVFPDSGDVPGPPIQFEELKPDSVKAGYTFTDPNMIGEVDEYFYHGDHISSVVLVTDKKAKVVQQFAYMPFGELLVDNSTVDLDYRFSAKETDRESGLGYFGARYYDNTSAMWLGVDPLWEKYAGMNPYNYCAGNPVMLVDRDGRENMIYLVNLQTKVNPNSVVNYVNNVFEGLGLNTKMKMAPKDFDPKYIDATDSYAIIGRRNDVKNYIKSKDIDSYKKYFDDWNSSNVAERAALEGEKWISSSCHTEGKFTSGVGVDTDVTSDVSCPEMKPFNTNAVEYTSFTIIHALGHNAKAIHPDERATSGYKFYPIPANTMTIMYSGNAMSNIVGATIPNLSDVMKLYPKSGYSNEGYVKYMQNRFGNNAARDNYEFNKKYKYY